MLRRVLVLTVGMAMAFALVATVPVVRSSASAGTALRGKQEQAAKANIYLVAKKSFCGSTGISDIYTGNGKVTFYMTLRNSGAKGGKVNIIPVRHYDDGTINESAMDMLIDVKVPARSVRRYRSPAYTYEAHNHEVEACGIKIDNRRESRIKVIHLP